MQSIRWYDKNPLLKEVFEFIQKLDTHAQIEIAKDILQILMSDSNIDIDKALNEINQERPKNCNRWYDSNIDLHSSFAILKKLPDGYRKIILDRIIESALLMYFGHVDVEMDNEYDT